MSGFDRVRETGFHAELIERTVVRLNGGRAPEQMLYHLETTFDDDSVFRHLDYLGLSAGRLVAFHLDEVSGGVIWATNTIPLRNVDSVEVSQIVEGQLDEHSLLGGLEPHLLLQILFNTHVSLDLEKVECDDPSCEYDHGYSGLLKKEGLAMRFFDDEPEGLSSTAEEAMDFAGSLAAAMGTY